MVYIFLITYFILLFFVSFIIIHLICEGKMNNDLLFNTISNYVLSFSFFVFLLYFKDYLYSLVNMFLLVINTIYLTYEINLSRDRYRVLSIPYLLFIFYVFYLIIDLYLIHL